MSRGCNYKGDEPSPKGFGYCAHEQVIGTVGTGTDGNTWVVKADKNGRHAWRKAGSPKTPKTPRSPKAKAGKIKFDSKAKIIYLQPDITSAAWKKIKQFIQTTAYDL